MGVDLQQFEYEIARCRIVLSIAALLVVYIDPEEPLLARWISFTSGSFRMDVRLFIVMAAYVAYSVGVYWALRNGRIFSSAMLARTIWFDVLFGVTIATMTEGVTGPSYPFFAFAVVASGMRGGLRQAMLVTAVNLGLYMCLIGISTRRGADVYIMRPLYLAITGYLVGYLWQQCIELQEQMRQLEMSEQRHRIARELHDGYAQALAGINLRLETSRRALQHGQARDEALRDLTDLQESVNREYDEFRSYARALAGVDPAPPVADENSSVQLSVSMEMKGSFELVDQVLSIAREGARNVRRHAQAKVASMTVRTTPQQISIAIDDDGVGFQGDVTPWSIASRVREVGGAMSVVDHDSTGAHLLITLPKV